MKRFFANNAQTAHPIRVDNLVLVVVPGCFLVFNEPGTSARYSGGG